MPDEEWLEWAGPNVLGHNDLSAVQRCPGGLARLPVVNEACAAHAAMKLGTRVQATLPRSVVMGALELERALNQFQAIKLQRLKDKANGL